LTNWWSKKRGWKSVDEQTKKESKKKGRLTETYDDNDLELADIMSGLQIQEYGDITDFITDFFV